MDYSRPQRKLLLLLAAILLAGLGVREWQADFPDTAERLERFDWEDRFGESTFRNGGEGGGLGVLGVWPELDGPPRLQSTSSF
jgi:hypothetical protein